MNQWDLLPHPCIRGIPTSLTLWKMLSRALAAIGIVLAGISQYKTMEPQNLQNPNGRTQLCFPLLKGRQLRESLRDDFSIKHLAVVILSSFLIQPKRFSQSHTTALNGSQSKAGQGDLTGGLAVGHKTLILEKAKVGNWSLGSGSWDQREVTAASRIWDVSNLWEPS